MAVSISFSLFTLAHRSHSPSFSSAPSSLSTHRFRSTPLRCITSTTTNPLPPHQIISSDDDDDAERRRLIEFPYASSPVRDLMVDLFSTVEERLKSELLPCSLPNDIRYLRNQSGTAQSSLYIRSAIKASKVDLILGNWLHNELPSGGSLDITTLSLYLSTATDAPNFIIEIIQTAPDALILLLDLPPRKDLVLHPEYLQAFYEQTQIDNHMRRKHFLQVPEIQPYYSSSLYIRSFVSPTAVFVSVRTDGGERMEEIVRENIRPAAEELLAMWLDKCVFGGGDTPAVEATEVEILAARDRMVRKGSIEIDMGSAFPMIFGEEIATRVLDVMRAAMGLCDI